MSIELDSVTWGVPGKVIIEEVTASVHDGEILGLLGPNGSGKSSLLRCLVGLREPSAGQVRVQGVDLVSLTPRQRARTIAFVEQTVELSDDLTVLDVVNLGRSPYIERWRGPRERDREIVESAMEQVGITHLASRRWHEVSGGERQRAHLARAFAQRTPFLALDEPTNHLDIRHQLELMEHLRGCGATVIVSLHDLGLAARYCDRLLIMSGGRLTAVGPPSEVLGKATIRRCFDVDAQVEARQGTWSVSFAPLRGVV